MSVDRAPRSGRTPRCEGSGRAGLDGRFPGDTDRCAVCSRNYVRVLTDGTLAAHKPGKGRRQQVGR